MAGLVRAWTERSAFGTNLGSHQSLWTRTEAHQNGLPGPQLGNPVAAQRLHVHEDVRRPLPAREEAEPAQAIEPFHLRAFETARGGDADVRARGRKLRRMDRSGVIHRQNAERLQALRTLQHLADNARALMGGLVTVTAQA